MPNETIVIDGQPQKIETRKINLVIPSAQMAMHKITYPKRVELDFAATTHHARKVQKLHSDFEMIWRLFMDKTNNGKGDGTPVDYSVTADHIRTMGNGALHLMGLFDLSLKLCDMGVPFVWKYPETCLHPGWQVALADVVIFLGNWGNGNPTTAVAGG